MGRGFPRAAAIVMCVICLISVFTVRSIVLPVRRLVKAAGQLAEGESNVAVSRGGIRELDQLTGAFNEMASELQAYHAERTLFGGKGRQKGILFSVAGRKGGDNFTCVTKVITAFFRNLGIEPTGQVLIDSVDAIKDIRTLPGREDEVKGLVSAGFGR